MPNHFQFFQQSSKPVRKKFKGFCYSPPLFILIIMKPQTAFRMLHSSTSAGINFYSPNKGYGITAIYIASLPISLTVLLQGTEVILKSFM